MPVWIAELAKAFWEEAGEVEAFPRNLRRPISRAVDLAVVSLSQLSIGLLFHWLRNMGIACELAGQDRPISACLVARNGHGIAFLDGGDPEAEQRFSLAHELAHFLRDYWQPRRRVVQRLGRQALEVLDGKRAPTTGERLHSLLRSTSLGFHVHLLERDQAGKPANLAIADSEQAADRLAFELLAPADHVLSSIPVSGSGMKRNSLEEILCRVYGLPGPQATHYSRIILPGKNKDSLLSRLRTAETQTPSPLAPG